MGGHTRWRVSGGQKGEIQANLTPSQSNLSIPHALFSLIPFEAILEALALFWDVGPDSESCGLGGEEVGGGRRLRRAAG